MERTLLDRIVKQILLLGSGCALGYCIYLGYRTWRKRQFKSIDEGFEDVSKIEETPVKRVLVLGLENAGKSTLISLMSKNSVEASKVLKPTKGFDVTTMDSNGICLTIWELGGKQEMRCFWPNFLQDTDILVFVADAANPADLSLAVKEIKLLLADERLDNVPVILVANKQDLKNALTPQQVADALDLASVPPSKHKIRVIGTQAPPGSQTRDPSISELEKMIISSINN